MISVDIKKETSSLSPLNTALPEQEEPTISFASLLKGEQESNSKIMQNGSLILALNDEKTPVASVTEAESSELATQITAKMSQEDVKVLIKEAKEINSKFNIFLDLKIYDIPNTMADAAESMANLGIDMFNVHASSGKVAMRGVMERLSEMQKPPLVLAVTALTSFDEESFQAVYSTPMEEKVKQFAKDAYESGLNGVVCSVFESALIKSSTDENFITLTPGIRLEKNSLDDQKRVANIQKAREEKSNIIVVGRPIYKSNDPQGVVEEIIKRMKI
ncbi:MAG: orotidine-5'-phosphate decarboxylase [Campylobacteraceae bacterium]|nr:orotidine-5'-phosphate decarboxylase [Campylobacteraceae bacterium]